MIRRVLVLCWVSCMLLLLRSAGFAAVGGNNADIPQFDIFVGFDSTTVEANWFPVVCEVRNEGPTFTAMFEFHEGSDTSDFVRRMPIELPTGTLKRFSFPMYTPGRYGTVFNAVLRDDKGRALARASNINPGKHLHWNSKLFCALPANAPGLPLYPGGANRDRGNRAIAHVARMQTALMPDNPIALGAMDALYLNSQRAVDLERPQAEAILSWLHGGGHLILGVDAVLDLNGARWLRQLIPGEFGSLKTVSAGGALFDWVSGGTGPVVDHNDPFQKLTEDPEFSGSNLRIVEFDASSATVDVSADGQPLIVSFPRERGRLTVLLFNPELEPIRSWKHRAWFWARLTDTPAELISDERRHVSSGTSVDGVFGAIVDSTQIRKLPVSALLLLLLVYLVVIGPLDQWWLKKINRQMLTWITFPCYVVLFSVLIWYIGYRLRAGESEWNELQVVDVIPNGQRAELHGTTFASIYSPVNETYPISGKEQFAALRPEAMGNHGGSGGRANIGMTADQYRAEITVPVWTSQSFINTWQQDGEQDFTATLTKDAEGYQVALRNKALPEGSRARLVLGKRVHDVEFPAPGQTITESIRKNGGVDITQFANGASGNFESAVSERRQALGSDQARFLLNPADASMAISLGRYIEPRTNQHWNHETRYLFPGNIDISELLEQGQALLLVYAEGYSPTPQMNDFNPMRSTRNSLMRLSLTIPE